MSELDIKTIRKDLSLTQEQFALELGVDRRTIINYEKGKPIPPSKIKLIEKLFNNGIDEKPMVKNIVSGFDKNSINTNKTFLNEISLLKDHIKSLKELIEDKNKLLEIYKNENSILKEKIVKLKENTVI